MCILNQNEVHVEPKKASRWLHKLFLFVTIPCLTSTVFVIANGPTPQDSKPRSELCFLILSAQQHSRSISMETINSNLPYLAEQIANGNSVPVFRIYFEIIMLISKMPKLTLWERYIASNVASLEGITIDVFDRVRTAVKRNLQAFEKLRSRYAAEDEDTRQNEEDYQRERAKLIISETESSIRINTGGLRLSEIEYHQASFRAAEYVLEKFGTAIRAHLLQIFPDDASIDPMYYHTMFALKLIIANHVQLNMKEDTITTPSTYIDWDLASCLRLAEGCAEREGFQRRM